MLAEIVRHTVVALLTVTIGVTGGVLRLHYRAYRRAPSGSGIVPLHVAVVSAGQLCLMAGAAVGILTDIGNGVSPVAPKVALYMTGCVLTLAALGVIGRAQRRRLAAAGRAETTGGGGAERS